MTAVRRFGFPALVLAVSLSAVVIPLPATTLALLSVSTTAPANTLAGAVFSPLSIAAPTVTTVNNVPRLTWTGVSITSGYPVSYLVTRTSSTGATSVACPAATISVVSGDQRQCDDTAAPGGDAYSYTVQPVIDRAGTTTWTRPASSSSAQVTLPRLRYAGVGVPTAFSNNSPTVVPYPTGTVAGDVLLFVARNARNKNITPPPGWTVLINTTSGNPASAFLVAWRLADAATSTSISINSSNDGAVAWIARWVRTPGITATPVQATASPVFAESATTVATFGATAQLTTTQGYASVVTVASTILGVAPTLSTDVGFTGRLASTNSAGSNSFSLALADRLVVPTASAVTSPTWASSTSTNTWQVLTVAFS